MATRGTGSAAVGVVVILLLFGAILAPTLLPLTASGLFDQVDRDGGQKAYYLAESGYRYARWRYHDASSSDRDQRLGDLHGRRFTLRDLQGDFALAVYPFFFNLASSTAGSATTLATTLTGGLPPEMDVQAIDRVKLGERICSISAVNVSGEHVTFTLAAPLGDAFAAGSDILPMARSVSSDQLIDASHRDLHVAGASADAFPRRNGWIAIGTRTLRYRVREAGVLRGIDDPQAATLTPLTVAAGSDIVLQKFARIESTGRHGEGAHQARRQTNYYQPLATVAQPVVWSDTFTDASHWRPSALGQHAAGVVDGDAALEVVSVAALGPGADVGSAKALDWESTPIDLTVAHRQAGFFLNYDAQVKLGIDAPGSRIAAGLLFRLQSDAADADTLGASLVMGNSSLAAPGDGIPDALVPEDDLPLVVVWQRIAGVTTRLAYQRYTGLLATDAEQASPGWNATGLWHRSARRPHSGSYSWYYGLDPQGNYDTPPTANSGELTSPPIDLCNRATLLFWSWYHTEQPELLDHKRVEISTDGGLSWSPTPLLTLGGQPQSWQRLAIDLAPFAGQQIRLRFRMDTVTADDNANEGWHIDDLVLINQDTTLMVRLREAAAARFTSGGPEPIEAGDVVYQPGGSGVVLEPPILTSGNWAAGNAAGWLLLNRQNGSLSLGTLGVSGASADAASIEELRARDNYLWFYVANACQSGDPATVADPTPLDGIRLANPRQTTPPVVIRWPAADPQQTTAANDYFTLISWQPGQTDGSVAILGSGKQASAILRIGARLTSSDQPHTDPELGLHTFGLDSTAVYFDDAALQTVFSSGGDADPVQE